MSPSKSTNEGGYQDTKSTSPGAELRTGLVVPTLNAGAEFLPWLESLDAQTLQPDRRLLIDSSSDDSTVNYAHRSGFAVRIIRREEFSHGGTRQLGVSLLADCDVIFFLTQDARLADRCALEKLLEPFVDPRVGAAYGRQLPRPDARPIEAHARLFNYPGRSDIRSLADATRLGIKTVFISNSFSAYRRSALTAVGGFPAHTIQNEDTYTASRMILNGWKVAYESGAKVYHSHDFRITDEFRRYFDIGVFHARDHWIRENFGQAEGEGMRFVCSELNYLKENEPQAIPSAVIRTGLKLIGYKLGHAEQHLPAWLKGRISSNRRYWQTEQANQEADK